ncbi:MAG: MBL fold metallo-hydrolase [Ignavibacteria bacterium]|jgi:glyoxylase-like metal-dependent hydrolase (beta-lactamase superfamily II)
MNIGPYTINLLETCRFGLDGGAMFGVVPKTLWERAYGKADEKNRIPMAAKVLCIRGNGRCILVDTGNSPYMPEKLAEIYGLDFSNYTIDSSLALHGLRPEDVTDVVFTHLHFDHAGGAMLADGTSRFANARHYVQRDHYNWALHPTEKDRASFIGSMYEPLFHAGCLELLDGPGELFPGIDVLPLFGHTKAMQAVRLSDGETTLFFPADLMPTSAHVPVPYVMGYDNFPLTTIDEKKQLLPDIIEGQWIVVFEHDARMDAARISAGERGPVISESICLTS